MSVKKRSRQAELAFQAQLLASVNDAVCAVDENNIITYWNSMAEKLFGWSAEEVMEKPSLIITEPGDEMIRIPQSGQYTGEIPNYHKNGEMINTDVHAAVLRGRNGELRGKVAILRDITEKKRYESSLQRREQEYLEIIDSFFEGAENTTRNPKIGFTIKSANSTAVDREKINALNKAMDMRDEFLSIISHELRTPITVINSAIQAMQQIYGDELPEKANSFLNMIMQNSNRQLKLVNNLLDFTLLNAGQFKSNKVDMDIVVMSRMITDSIRVYAEQKGIRLSFSSTMKEKIIRIDVEKWERILLNLLSNAVKFTPKGKAITVRMSRKIYEGANKICVRVKDNGIGIPPDKKEVIFERFGQVDSSLSRRAEGSGIGLSITKMLVEGLGGKITLESKVGKGSTFTVILPDEGLEEMSAEKRTDGLLDDHLAQAVTIEFSDV
jgi:PAS domain S-box-containing protein